MITKSVTLKQREQKVQYHLARNQLALLMPVGDVHFGAQDFPQQQFVEHLQWGMDRGAYFLGMGDYLEFAPDSQRKPFTQLRDSTRLKVDMDVRAEAERFCELISFTAGSWIGLIHGNHTWTFMDGTCVEQLICGRLGCDYLGTMTMLRLVPEQALAHHPEADTIVVAHHGMGGGQTIGGHLNQPEKMMKFTQADVILMGHSHAKLVGSIDKIMVTPDGKYSHRTTLVARTGAFLKAYAGHEPLPLDAPAYESEGSYVEQKGLMPSSMGGICIGIGVEKIPDSIYYRPILHYSV
jgi:hypothetical protein